MILQGLPAEPRSEVKATTSSVVRAMNIDVLDYAGHPCQAQLSKALASRGHEVRHLHCPDYVSGKGSLQSHATDPASYTVKSLSLGSEFKRYNPLTRVWQEIRFGLAAAAAIRRRKPDVVLLSNVPLIAHFVLSRLVSVTKLPMVFWQQDVYSRAIAVSAENRLGFTGRLIGRAADRVERDIARRSAGVIPITDAFMPTLRRWKVDDARIATIPNWAPIDEMPCLPRRNAWSMDHDLDGRHVLLYSGTLGLKHDPSILLRIARLLHAEDPEARLMVVSEGAGRSWLEEHKGPDLPQLVLADYQPYDVLPEVLASADILIAILEPAAGVFSVPSKILSYMCAGRPTLAVMPPSNLAAKIISRVSAGIVVEPGDLNGIDTAVRKLRADEVRRDEMGFNARSYAEATFDITQIAQCFEARLAAAAGLARSAGCQ